jgi:hypothetical protein
VAPPCGFGNADGSAGTVTYQDVIIRTGEGWWISHRKVIAHPTPLGDKAGITAAH